MTMVRVLVVGTLERDAHSLHLAVDDPGTATGDDNAFGRWHEELALIAGMDEVECEARLVDSSTP